MKLRRVGDDAWGQEELNCSLAAGPDRITAEDWLNAVGAL